MTFTDTPPFFDSPQKSMVNRDLFRFAKSGTGRRLFPNFDAFTNLLEEQMQFVISNQDNFEVVWNHLQSLAFNSEQHFQCLRWIVLRFNEAVRSDPEQYDTLGIKICLASLALEYVSVAEEAVSKYERQLIREELKEAHLDAVVSGHHARMHELRAEGEQYKQDMHNLKKEVAEVAADAASSIVSKKGKIRDEHEDFTRDRAILLINRLIPRAGSIDATKKAELIAFFTGLDLAGTAKRFGSVDRKDAESSSAFREDMRIVRKYLKLLDYHAAVEQLDKDMSI
jgi:hypothetical protein